MESKTESAPRKVRAMPSPRFRAKRDQEAKRKRAHTLNLKEIQRLSAIGMSIDSIAHRIGVSPNWLHDKKKLDYDLERAIIDGQYEFEDNLRSVQARLALSGHPGMLIWLGKQFLGQSDKQENKTETTVNIVLQNAMKELRDMSADDLAEIKSVLERKREPLTIDNGEV